MKASLIFSSTSHSINVQKVSNHCPCCSWLLLLLSWLVWLVADIQNCSSQSLWPKMHHSRDRECWRALIVLQECLKALRMMRWHAWWLCALRWSDGWWLTFSFSVVWTLGLHPGPGLLCQDHIIGDMALSYYCQTFQLILFLPLQPQSLFLSALGLIAFSSCYWLLSLSLPGVYMRYQVWANLGQPVKSWQRLGWDWTGLGNNWYFLIIF